MVYVRIFDGAIRVGDKIRMMGTGRNFSVSELNRYTPHVTRVKEIGWAQVGSISASIKSLADVRVGDTVTLEGDPATEALPGYEEPKQMVFCDFYPSSADGEAGTGKKASFEALREAIERLHLNDASFTFETQHSEALGFGYRCGFLGLLHMDIVQERLEREGGVEIVQTAPTVMYKVDMTSGEEREIHNPVELPDPSQMAAIREPIAKLEIMCPELHHKIAHTPS